MNPTEEIDEMIRLRSTRSPSIVQMQRWKADIERTQAALRIFVGCAYPVAKEINPRGHAWRPEDSLDYALSEAKAALGIVDQQSTPSSEERK